MLLILRQAENKNLSKLIGFIEGVINDAYTRPHLQPPFIAGACWAKDQEPETNKYLKNGALSKLSSMLLSWSIGEYRSNALYSRALTEFTRKGINFRE
jgi:hypothetical protein